MTAAVVGEELEDCSVCWDRGLSERRGDSHYQSNDD